MRQEKINKKKKADSYFIAIMLLFPVLHFFVFYIGINFNSILLAFQKYDLSYRLSFAGTDNFSFVLKSLSSSGDVLGRGVVNSIKVFLFTTVIGFPLTMLFSFYLYKRNFGSNIIRFCAMIPAIISGVIMAMLFVKVNDGPLPDIMELLGLPKVYLLSQPDTILPSIIFFSLWTGFSTSLIIYPNAMFSIPREVSESARIDGAGDLDELLKITLPLIYPTITTFFVVGIAGVLSFSGPLFAFYEYNAPPVAWTSGYYLFRSVMGPGTSIINYPVAAAAGLVLTVVAAPVTIFSRWLFDRFGPSEDK